MLLALSPVCKLQAAWSDMESGSREPIYRVFYSFDVGIALMRRAEAVANVCKANKLLIKNLEESEALNESFIPEPTGEVTLPVRADVEKVCGYLYCLAQSDNEQFKSAYGVRINAAVGKFCAASHVWASEAQKVVFSCLEHSLRQFLELPANKLSSEKVFEALSKNTEWVEVLEVLVCSVPAKELRAICLGLTGSHPWCKSEDELTKTFNWIRLWCRSTLYAVQIVVVVAAGHGPFADSEATKLALDPNWGKACKDLIGNSSKLPDMIAGFAQTWLLEFPGCPEEFSDEMKETTK